MSLPISHMSSLNSLLSAAGAALQVGHMIHGQAFSLFEAMSAVEIGNPKMDSGAQPPIEAPQSSHGLAPSHTVQELVSTMDHQLLLEASWFSGNSFMQTLYSCTQFTRCQEQPSSSPALDAYCKALEASCELVRQLVMKGGVCEEEDFSVYMGTWPLMDKPVQELTEPAVTALQYAISHQELGEAVHLRLQYRLAFLQALALLVGSGSTPTASDSQPPPVAQLTDAAMLFAEAHQLLTCIITSTTITGSSAFQKECCCPAAFQHMLGPAPPRRLQDIVPSQLFAHLKTQLTHFESACRVYSVSDLYGLQLMLYDFARQQPTALPRSALHWLIIPDRYIGTCGSAQEATTPSLQGSSGDVGTDAGLPPWVPSTSMLAAACCVSSSAVEAAPEVAQFMDQALIAVNNFCQSMLMNSCRLRRRLRHNLEDWQHMVAHGQNADLSEGLRSHLAASSWLPFGDQPTETYLGPLSCWAETQSCYAMLMYLLWGFDLEVYLPHEAASVYWYIDFLGAHMLQIESAVQPHRPLAAPVSPAPQPQGLGNLPARGKGKGKAGGGASSSLVSQVKQVQVQSPQPSPAKGLLMLQVEALVLLSKGIFQLLAGLLAADGIRAPKLEANTPAQVFRQRFGLFLSMARPPALVYDDWLATSAQLAIQGTHVLGLALETLAQAKRRLDFFGHLLQPQAATSHARLPHQSAYADGPLAAARMVQLNALQRLLMQNHVAVQVAVRKLQQVQEQQQCVSMSGDEANSAIESATAGTGPSLAGLVGLDYSAVRTFPAITLGKPKGCCA